MTKRIKRVTRLSVVLVSLILLAVPRLGAQIPVTGTTTNAIRLAPNVASLPASPKIGTTYVVTNGLSATDCSAGGGTNVVACLWNGSSWAALGSAGGNLTATTPTVNGVLIGQGSQALGVTGAGAADTLFMGNDAGTGSAPAFKAGPSGGTNGCAGTTDTPTYNTSTHAWGCHQIAGGGGGVSYGAGSASATAYVVTVSPAITSQPAGTAVIVLPGANNTTATTSLTANSLATMTITTCGQQALQAGDMVTTKDALFVSDGTYWQLQNPQRTRCGDLAYALGTVTTSATVTPVNGFFQTVTLTAATACTFGFTQPTTGTVTVTVVVNQAATPTGTAVWTSVLWPGGVVPVVTASASAVDIFSFKLDGTHIYGMAGQAFQ